MTLTTGELEEPAFEQSRGGVTAVVSTSRPKWEHHPSAPDWNGQSRPPDCSIPRSWGGMGEIELKGLSCGHSQNAKAVDAAANSLARGATKALEVWR